MLPTGIKVVAAPKDQLRIKLLSGPDIETSGGCHVVEFKHFLGVGKKIFFVVEIFPSKDPGGYGIEIMRIRYDPGERPTPHLERVPTFTALREVAQLKERTLYNQALDEAINRATILFQTTQGESAKSEAQRQLGSWPLRFQRPDFRFEVIEAADWKKKLAELLECNLIDNQWIEEIAAKTKSTRFQQALRELQQIQK
ncbi:MAG: hypothetical protein ABSH22_07575 [Tepidisphaeraceae bacterium]